MPFLEIFICFYCEKEFEDRNQLQDHQPSCSRVRSGPARGGRSRGVARRGGRRRPAYKCKEDHPDTYTRPDHKSFVEAVGLIPRSKLATFQKKKNNKEIKFEVIEIDDCPIPKTPTTPRSAKSLISQLSRDLSPPPSVSKHRRYSVKEEPKDEEEEDGEAVVGEQEQGKDEASNTPDNRDTDGESVCSSRSDTVESQFNPRRVTSLLTIDLCSLLGQRVKKHVDKLDSSERNPYEEFCHTPVKKQALERLRNRPSLFPVTFRKSKRIPPEKCHWYKFTKRDRREFMRIMVTGLTKRARELKRLLVPCKVVLQRLNKAEIVAWTTPRKRPDLLRGFCQPNMWQLLAQQTASPRVLLQNMFPQAASAMFLPHQQIPHYLGGRSTSHHGLPLQSLNPAHPQGRPYKAVLSGRSQVLPHSGVPSLNAYQLPLSCPSANRNFGKALQPGGFYGPHQSRPQPLSNRGYRPNILSKENGALHHNKTVRRLSMDSPGKADLTAEYLRSLPSAVPRKRPEDDVISISSTESESEPMSPRAPPSKRPLPEDRNNNMAAAKRPRLSGGSGGGTQVVLFRCHLCHQEITCKLGQTSFIEKHFAEEHAVNNIHLLEHTDSNNQKVVTIVEDNGPRTNNPRLSNGGGVPGGRFGGQDRAVLRDSVIHSQGHMGPGLLNGRVRNTESRCSDGKPRRTNMLDTGPAEIIILD